MSYRFRLTFSLYRVYLTLDSTVRTRISPKSYHTFPRSPTTYVTIHESFIDYHDRSDRLPIVPPLFHWNIGLDVRLMDPTLKRPSVSVCSPPSCHGHSWFIPVSIRRDNATELKGVVTKEYTKFYKINMSIKKDSHDT